jgi:hypothetical protein
MLRLQHASAPNQYTLLSHCTKTECRTVLVKQIENECAHCNKSTHLLVISYSPSSVSLRTAFDITNCCQVLRVEAELRSSSRSAAGNPIHLFFLHSFGKHVIQSNTSSRAPAPPLQSNNDDKLIVYKKKSPAQLEDHTPPGP